MEVISVMNIEEKSVVTTLQEAAKNLDGTGVETVLDLSSVRRLDSSSLRAMHDLAALADEKQSKVTLRGVSAELYKTLKLAKLTRTLSFSD
jgi:anti-anti-sigma regulatory factor